MLAAAALLVMSFAASQAVAGIIEGNYIALTYILISIAELWVSAIGLSMIGLYCDNRTIAFAMGVWYLSNSLSNALSGKIAGWVAIPEQIHTATERLPYYEHYYWLMGLSAFIAGLFMFLLAYVLHQFMNKKGIALA